MARIKRIAWGGGASALVGLGVQIAFPGLDPVIGYGLIAVGVVMATIAVTLWFADKEPSAASAGTVMHNPVFNFPYENLVKEATKLGPREDQIFPPTVTQGPPPTGLTLNATGVVFPQGLYAGWMIASAGRLADENMLEIAVRAFNGTGRQIRVVGVDGAIQIGDRIDNIQSLPLPAWRGPEPPVEPFAEFTVILEQRLPAKLVAEFLETLDRREPISFDLQDLHVRIELMDDHQNRGRLPLWDGLTLLRRDDIFTGRIIMLRAESGSFSVRGGEAKLSVKRSDGSEEIDSDAKA